MSVRRMRVAENVVGGNSGLVIQRRWINEVFGIVGVKKLSITADKRYSADDWKLVIDFGSRLELSLGEGIDRVPKCKDNITCLYIPMHDRLRVKVVETKKYLSTDLSGKPMRPGHLGRRAEVFEDLINPASHRLEDY